MTGSYSCDGLCAFPELVSPCTGPGSAASLKAPFWSLPQSSFPPSALIIRAYYLLACTLEHVQALGDRHNLASLPPAQTVVSPEQTVTGHERKILRAASAE